MTTTPPPPKYAAQVPNPPRNLALWRDLAAVVLGVLLWTFFDTLATKAVPSIFSSLFSYYGAKLGLFTLLLILYLVLTRQSLTKNGFSAKVSFRHVAYGLSLFWVIALLGRLIAPSFDEMVYGQLGVETAGLVTGVALYLVVLLLAAASEEVFFRGLFQNLLQKRFPFLMVMLVVSLHFALFHIGWLEVVGVQNSIAQMVSAFLASLILMAVFFATKSLLTVLALHLASNTLVVFQILIRFRLGSLEEVALWVVWGVFSLFFLKKAGPWLGSFFRKQPVRMNVVSLLVLIALALLPLLLFLLRV